MDVDEGSGEKTPIDQVTPVPSDTEVDMWSPNKTNKWSSITEPETQPVDEPIEPDIDLDELELVLKQKRKLNTEYMEEMERENQEKREVAEKSPRKNGDVLTINIGEPVVFQESKLRPIVDNVSVIEESGNQVAYEHSYCARMELGHSSEEEGEIYDDEESNMDANKENKRTIKTDDDDDDDEIRCRILKKPRLFAEPVIAKKKPVTVARPVMKDISELAKPNRWQHVKFKKREISAEIKIIYEFLAIGVDKEDSEYIKRSYDSMMADDSTNYWLNSSKWIDHCVTDLRATAPFNSRISKRKKGTFIISAVDRRNSERAFNYALGFADKMFFQGLYVFYLRRGIGSLIVHNKISNLVT